MASRDTLCSSRSGGVASPFFPPLTKQNTTSIQNERLFHTPPSNHNNGTRLPNHSSHLPRLGGGNPEPTTTKYTDFRKLRQRRRPRSNHSSDEDLVEKPEPIETQKPIVGLRKHRSNSQDRYMSY